MSRFGAENDESPENDDNQNSNFSRSIPANDIGNIVEIKESAFSIASTFESVKKNPVNFNNFNNSSVPHSKPAPPPPKKKEKIPKYRTVTKYRTEKVKKNVKLPYAQIPPPYRPAQNPSHFNLYIINEDYDQLAPGQWLSTTIVSVAAKSLEVFCKEIDPVNYYNNVLVCLCEQFAVIQDDEAPEKIKKKKSQREKWLTPDIVCFPIHDNKHFTACVMDFVAGCVHYFDSFGSDGISYVQDVCQFYYRITDDSKFLKYQQAYIENPTKRRFPLPRQQNGFDCGVFCVKFLEATLRKRKDPQIIDFELVFGPFDEQQSRLNDFRKRLLAELGKPTSQLRYPDSLHYYIDQYEEKWVEEKIPYEEKVFDEKDSDEDEDLEETVIPPSINNNNFNSNEISPSQKYYLISEEQLEQLVGQTNGILQHADDVVRKTQRHHLNSKFDP